MREVDLCYHTCRSKNYHLCTCGKSVNLLHLWQASSSATTLQKHRHPAGKLIRVYFAHVRVSMCFFYHTTDISWILSTTFPRPSIDPGLYMRVTSLASIWNHFART